MSHVSFRRGAIYKYSALVQNRMILFLSWFFIKMF